MSADPYLDVLQAAAQQVTGCIGDRLTAFLPDGRTYLVEATDKGVLMTLAENDDEIALWMMRTRGNA